MKLYEITGQFEALDNMIPDITSQEDSDAYSELFDQLQGTLQEKVHGYCCVIRNTDNYAAAIDIEIKRLQAKKKALENKSKRIADHLKNNLLAAEIKSVKTSIFNVGFQKNPPSVKIIDESIVPEKYKSYKIEINPMKDKIKAAIDSGVVVPGCELVQEERIVIK